MSEAEQKIAAEAVKKAADDAAKTAALFVAAAVKKAAGKTGADNLAATLIQAADDAAAALPEPEPTAAINTTATPPLRIFGIYPWVVFLGLFLVLVVPSSIFIFNSFGKLDEILLSISKPPVSETDKLFNLPVSEDKIFSSRAIVALERDVIYNRLHVTKAALATRTWMRFMSLVFGAILVVIGAAFILGKISTKDTNTGEFSFGDVKGSLATSSPGLMLVFMGSLLIAVPNFSTQSITTNDTGSFIAKGLASGVGGQPIVASETPDGKEDIERIIMQLKKQEVGADK